MGLSSGAAAFRLQFAVSPIIMTGGIASGISGGALPVLQLSQAISFVGGLLSPGSATLNLDDYFAYFQPLPGGTLIDQQIGMYPFANQTVAANATIQQPLTISMLMICPVGNGSGYTTKPSIMQGMVQSFKQHNTSGGLYTILTPSFPYIDAVMLNMTDVSGGQTRQVQWQYKLDFLLPLVTLQQATGAYNSLMGQINGGLPTNGAQSGAGGFIGTTAGAVGPTFIPSSGQGALAVAGAGAGAGGGIGFSI